MLEHPQRKDIDGRCCFHGAVAARLGSTTHAVAIVLVVTITIAVGDGGGGVEDIID